MVKHPCHVTSKKVLLFCFNFNFKLLKESVSFMYSSMNIKINPGFACFSHYDKSESCRRHVIGKVKAIKFLAFVFVCFYGCFDKSEGNGDGWVFVGFDVTSVT